MRKITLLLLICNISCERSGQEQENTLNNYQQIIEVIENKDSKNDDNKFSRIYNEYYTIDEDTVLLKTNIYEKGNKIQSDTLNRSVKEKKSFLINKDVQLTLFERGKIFSFKKNDDKYSVIGKIKNEEETLYDDLGEAYVYAFYTHVRFH